MSDVNETGRSLQDLQQLLDVHGGDRTRWPAAERLRLASFIASQPMAATALDEAMALDRLLDLAPTVSVERERALAARIVSAAAAAKAVPADVAAGRVVALRRPAASSFMRHAGAVLLAASLVLGIFAGATGQISSTVEVLAEALGLADDEPELALAVDPVTSGEEAL